MNKRISVIGGDQRSAILARKLIEDKNDVLLYGLEEADVLKNCTSLKMCNTIDEAIDKSDIIIGPIPFSIDNENLNTKLSKNKIKVEDFLKKKYNKKVVIAGNVKTELAMEIEQNDGKFFDILKREELAVLNAIPTAEGTIEIAIHETNITIQESNVLILGFGRTGKVLARKLYLLGANVYCEARKSIDLAWIKADGYNAIELDKLEENLNKFDIIINTIPFIILDKNRLDIVKKDCIIIDIASNPGGVDREYAKFKGIKAIWTLAIPGKVAPVTSAQYIKETIYNILKEI